MLVVSTSKCGNASLLFRSSCGMMSAMGQELTFAPATGMSALGHNRTSQPEMDLVNHLVGERNQARWDFETKCFRRPRVDT